VGGLLLELTCNATHWNIAATRIWANFHVLVATSHRVYLATVNAIVSGSRHLLSWHCLVVIRLTFESFCL